MSRTRLVRPAFFKHYELYRAEVESGLPLRVAFAGLWTVTDRSGRFRWKGDIKTDVIPYDPVDMLTVLDALERYGFITKYTVGGRKYGWIPTFKDHQSFHVTERASTLPPSPLENREVTDIERSDTVTDTDAVTGTVTIAGADADQAASDPSAQRDSVEQNPAPDASAAAPRASAPPTAAAELPGDVKAFLRRFYPRDRAPEERRRDVTRQLLATLTEKGASLGRGKGSVRAYSIDRLAAKCREVIDEASRVRDPDRAIVVLLKKLGDTSDGSAPGSKAADEQRATARQEERTNASDSADAEEWLSTQAELRASIEKELKGQGLSEDDVAKSDFKRMARVSARESLVLREWRKHGSPTPAHA